MQPENTLSPMFVTPSGIVIEVKPMQPENALPPMFVTLAEIVIEVKLARPENASSLMRSPLVIVTVLSWLLLM